MTSKETARRENFVMKRKTWKLRNALVRKEFEVKVGKVVVEMEMYGKATVILCYIWQMKYVSG